MSAAAGVPPPPPPPLKLVRSAAAATNNVEATTYPQLPESNNNNNWPDQVLRFKEQVNFREFEADNMPGLMYYEPNQHAPLAKNAKKYYVHPNILPHLKGKRSKVTPKNPLTSAKMGASGISARKGFPAYTLPAGSVRRNDEWSEELGSMVSAARKSAENKAPQPRTMKNARAAAIAHHAAWQAENNAEQRALKFAKVKGEAMAALNASRKMRAESVKANAEKALAASRALRAKELNALVAAAAAAPAAEKKANAGAGKSRRQRRDRKGRKTRRHRK